MKKIMIFLSLIVTIMFVSCKDGQKQFDEALRQHDGVLEYGSIVSTAIAFTNKDLKFLQLEKNKLLYLSYQASVRSEREFKSRFDSFVSEIPEENVYIPIKYSGLKYKVNVEPDISRHEEMLKKYAGLYVINV